MCHNMSLKHENAYNSASNKVLCLYRVSPPFRWCGHTPLLHCQLSTQTGSDYKSEIMCLLPCFFLVFNSAEFLGCHGRVLTEYPRESAHGACLAITAYHAFGIANCFQLAQYLHPFKFKRMRDLIGSLIKTGRSTSYPRSDNNSQFSSVKAILMTKGEETFQKSFRKTIHAAIGAVSADYERSRVTHLLCNCWEIVVHFADIVLFTTQTSYAWADTCLT